MAVASYYNSEQPSPQKDTTIVIPGMNHYQFVASGTPPSHVAKNDIKPEIDNAAALKQVTEVIATFIQFTLGDISKKSVLTSHVALSAQLLDPLISMLKLEGFFHFDPPCSLKTKPEKCIVGSPFTERVQQQMAGPTVTLIDSDELRPVQNLPAHLPKIYNNCTPPTPCTLNVTTVTYNIYSLEDAFDTGMQPVAAETVRIKLSSRQALILAASNVTVDFNESDGSSLCAEINQNTIDWVKTQTPAATLARYAKIGKQLIPVADKVITNGPEWIWTDLVCLKDFKILIYFFFFFGL